MSRKSQLTLLIVLGALAVCSGQAVSTFEGRIQAVATQNGSSENLFYTVATNAVRIEVAETNTLNPVNLLDRSSGIVKVLFPRTHCYMNVKPGSQRAHRPTPATPPAALPVPPQPVAAAPLNPPPGVGPRVTPGVGAGPGSPTMPAMPAMPAMPQRPAPASMAAMAIIPADAPLDLRATGRTTHLLGYDCKEYIIQQWGQTMDIWATDQLTAFQAYLQAPPRRFGAPSIERRWSDRLAAKGLFPLLASLRLDNGQEQYRFEVQSITPARLTDEDCKCFQMPEGYTQIPSHQF